MTGGGLSERRLAAVASLAVSGESVLLTSPASVRWVSGFTGSHGVVLVRPDEPAVLFTDGRYTEQARSQSPGFDVQTVPNGLAAATGLLADSSAAAVAVDAGHLTAAQAGALQERGIATRDAGAEIERLRMVKTDDELDALRRACRISVEALAQVAAQIEMGMSERYVARLLEFTMAELGADDRSFETIVAAGPHAALPHHEPTDTPLRAGDLLVVDFGALAGGMHADCTRTFIVGAEPAGWQAEIHRACEIAAERGRQAVRAGVTLREVDEAARSSLHDAGWADHFMHGVGHGVGLVVHEAPMLAADGTHPLEPATPLTVEPGIYLPGRGGVRVEDTVVVRGDGCEVLTEFPRELQRVG